MVTISDVARTAGVSRATVSYVLNDPHNQVRISPDTRQKVLETAAALGYRRNELARAVTTGKNPMLGFWVMQSNREPVVRVLSGAMKAADETGYFIKMIGVDNNTLDARTLERCVEWRLAGIIAIHAPETNMRQLYPEIVSSGIPFVTVDSQEPPAGCLNITADGAAGLADVVRHLASQGHQKIAFLGGLQEDSDSISGARERAYKEAMISLGLQQHIQMAHGDWRADFHDWESGATARAARQLLEHPSKVTAIACASDHMAMIVIRLATARGLRVPQDLSVTGFDDLTVANLYNPPLTTVAQPFEQLGRQAVRQLVAGPAAPPFTPLPTQLIVRASSGPVPS